jgi:hypothetical protein
MMRSEDDNVIMTTKRDTSEDKTSAVVPIASNLKSSTLVCAYSSARSISNAMGVVLLFILTTYIFSRATMIL